MATDDVTGSDRIAELVHLLDGSDTCELKLTVSDSQVGAVSRSLGFDVLKTEIREVVFFDTPTLDLSRRGLVVRARRRKKGRGDTVVKLRPVTPAQLSPAARQSKNVGVEVDAMPGGFVCSASMKGTTTSAAIREVILGEAGPKDLFSKEQRAAFKELAPAGLKINDLAVMGPITILKLKSSPKGFDNKLVAEMWLYPDGSRILELSTKCLPEEAFDVATRWELSLRSHGVDVSGAQQTKTATALAYFSALLKE